MTERLNKGNNLTIRTDEIVNDDRITSDSSSTNEVFVMIEDSNGDEILKVSRSLWDSPNDISGFTKEMRADILKK